MLDLDPGARRLGELGLGLNSGIDRFTGSILYDEKIGGTVHLALGQSYPETGGVNNSALHWDLIVDTRTERPDHRRRPARDGKRTLAGGLIRADARANLRNRRTGHATRLTSSGSVRWVLLGVPAVRRLACRRRRAQAAADAALKDRVLQLVDRLDADKVEARDTATASLIKLGPKILPLLPDAATVKSAERKERLERIRAALIAKQDEVNTGASKVTITGKGIRLSEALQQLQKQTGNAITDLREQLGAEVTNPALDLDLRDKPFFEALDQIARHGRGLDSLLPPATARSASWPAHRRPRRPACRPPRAKPLILYSGPFRIELQQLSLSRDFQTGTALANVRLEAAWEPRLRPMLLKLKAEEMKIVDDRKKDVKPQVAAESDEVVIRPENPSAEINLNLEAPERDAKKIASLLVKAEVTIPAGIKTFKFPSLAQKDVTVKQGDVSLTLEDTEVDEQVWKVNVTLVYPGEGPAFESYRQGLFNNRLWLQRADGSRFEHNGGFSTTPAPTAASSASSISSSTLPASRPITSSFTKPRAR